MPDFAFEFCSEEKYVGPSELFSFDTALMTSRLRYVQAISYRWWL